MPGSMGIPLPSPGMFTDESAGGEVESESIDPSSGRIVRRPSSSARSGCFCNSNGCTGSECSSMNGCVCSQGACWGAACDSRIVAPPNTASTMLTSGNLISTTSTLPTLSNSLQLVRNALFAAPAAINGQQQQQQQSGQQVSANTINIGDCSCNSLGCSGSGCGNMNGCFCVGSACWGNSCNSLLQQASGNFLQQSNQFQLPNLSGQITLPNGQTANLINIPGLTGPGGILSSLLPGAFGGGGGNFGGPGMEVTQGIPVKRLKATRAKRIRSKPVDPEMEYAASRGRVRRKRIRPRVQAEETSQTFTFAPDPEGSEPLLNLIQLNQLKHQEGRLEEELEEEEEEPANLTTLNSPTIDFNKSALVDSTIDQLPEESLDVFTLTDQWL